MPFQSLFLYCRPAEKKEQQEREHRHPPRGSGRRSSSLLLFFPIGPAAEPATRSASTPPAGFSRRRTETRGPDRPGLRSQTPRSRTADPIRRPTSTRHAQPRPDQTPGKAAPGSRSAAAALRKRTGRQEDSRIRSAAAALRHGCRPHLNDQSGRRDAREKTGPGQKRKQNKTGNRPNSPKPEANHQNPKAKKKLGTRSARAGSSAQPNRRHDQTPGKHQARPAPPRSAQPRQSSAPLFFNIPPLRADQRTQPKPARKKNSPEPNKKAAQPGRFPPKSERRKIFLKKC